MARRWPTTLWIVRHGESAGNVARDAADAAGHERIAIGGRDVDVPLSDRGRLQADALGRWFGHGGAGAQPDVLLVSPYVRAVETAERFRDAGGCGPDVPICYDERLREKEFGVLDGLTRVGILAHEPQQAEFRRILGKFYHRPPGGESWCDVIFRLRALLDTISLHHAEKRVMIVAHQVVVLCMRYILENMSEAEVLAVDAAGDVANCAVTEYLFDRNEGRDGKLMLARYNVTAPMEAEGAPVTAEPDAKAQAA